MKRIFFPLILLLGLYGAAQGQNRGVGIGVSPPRERLHVVGNFRLEGAFMPGANAGTAGQFLQSAGPGTSPVWVAAPGGGGANLSGLANFGTRWRTNTVLGMGLVHDDSTQLVIRRSALAVPYSNLNFFTAIEALNTGLNTPNNQRIALGVVSQDSSAIDVEVISPTSNASAIFAFTNSSVSGSVGVDGVSGAGIDISTFGVQGTDRSPSRFFSFPDARFTPFAKSFNSSAGVSGTGGLVNPTGPVTSVGHGVQGITFSDANFSAGVYGETFPFGTFVNGGQIPLNAGVLGYSFMTGPAGSNSIGVLGLNDSYTEANGNKGGGGYGVWGWTTGGAGIGVRALADRPNGDPALPNAAPNYGVWATARSTEGNSAAVRGVITKTQTAFDGGYDGSGVNGPGFGILGESYFENANAAGVKGISYAANVGYGVFGESANRVGVYGLHTALTGTSPGVLGVTASTAAGSRGIEGRSAETGETYGLYGICQSPDQRASGVYGLALAGRAYGVTGVTESDQDDAMGVVGLANAVAGNESYGVFGSTNSTSASAAGVYGIGSQTAAGTPGVVGVSLGESAGSSGIVGRAETVTATNNTYGVSGYIRNANATSAGIFGEDDVAGPGGSTSWAGWFNGNVNVTDSMKVIGLRATRINGAVKHFEIDHPSDPANKLLRHGSIESSEYLNVYSGNITTDVNGVATVVLPSYMQVLNVDFRYQLTVIGQFAAAIVSKKIENNRFEIKTDKPNVEVSWQITGKRNDPYVRMNPLVVEQEKSAAAKGTYFYPQAYQPTTGKPNPSVGSAVPQTRVVIVKPHIPERPEKLVIPAPPNIPTEAQKEQLRYDWEAQQKLYEQMKRPTSATTHPALENEIKKFKKYQNKVK